MGRIKLKRIPSDGGIPKTAFTYSTLGKPFSFTTEAGTKYEGIQTSISQSILNIPGGIEFEGLFEWPESLKGERRTIKRMWDRVAIE